MIFLPLLLSITLNTSSNSVANSNLSKNHLVQCTAFATINDFDLVKKEKTVMIQWSTNIEVNNCCFEIEKSLDGTIFKNIGKVTGGINTNKESWYVFTDEAPTAGKLYYRIKLLNIDGKTDGSFTKSLVF